MNSSTQTLHLTTNPPTTLHGQTATLIFAISMILMAVSTYLTGSHKSLDFSVQFYGFDTLLNAHALSYIATFAFGLAALLTLLCQIIHSLTKSLGVLLIIISLIPLGTLLSDSVWIASLGGFPAIGSGQGIIKYFALLAIGIYLAAPKRLSDNTLMWLNFLPVAIVYLWIGGMKFTLIEAQGIEPLVSSSPLLSWLYSFFDLQTASNLIGLYDLAIVALLGLSLWFKRFIVPALIAASTVFIVTQSFFITWDNALSPDTIISSGGQFLIKDLWYLVNLVIIYRIAVAKIKSGTSAVG